MNRGSLWRISVVTSPEAEEAVAELAGRTLGLPVSTYLDLESGAVTVALYSRTRPAEWKRSRARLRVGLGHIRSCGLPIKPGRVSIRRLRRENWTESWKRHFQPIEIGRTLLVKPSWSRRRLKRGQQQIIIDPGLSFGTGHHATTRFCLGEIVRHRRPGRPQSFLDIGSGSGILSIAAAKLGYDPVSGFDLDPEAVRVALANVQVNQMSKRVKIHRRDISRPPRGKGTSYDLVCANLTSDLLLRERHAIARRVRPDGILVLAGILEVEFRNVQKAFTSMGLRMLRGRGEGEWYSGSFSRAV